MSFLAYLQNMISSGTLKYAMGVFDTIINNPIMYAFVSILITSVCIYFVRRLIWG